MEDYTAEMIRDMAFSFCPQCGTAIVPNHKGRPRKFCSPECRSRWNNTHPKPENWRTVRSKICPVCGREFSYRGRVQLDIYGEGQNTLSLFDRARSHVQRSSNVYKHVWIVYDTDDFPQDNINRTAELCARSSTEETEYENMLPALEYLEKETLNFGNALSLLDNLLILIT